MKIHNVGNPKLETRQVFEEKFKFEFLNFIFRKF